MSEAADETTLADQLSVAETLEIAASADAVWAVIEHFDALAQWAPGIASSAADKGDAIGSLRKVVLKAPGDPAIIEQLTAHDAAGRSYSYIITEVDPALLPVRHYASTLIVRAAGDGAATVEWRGAFEAATPESRDAALGAVAGIYRGGLKALKQRVEAGA